MARPLKKRPPEDADRPHEHDYVRWLGLRAQGGMLLHERVEEGLPYTAFERLRRRMGLTLGEMAELVQTRVRTVHRRREEGRFHPDESDRLLRASRVWGRALDLFEGDEEGARRWLASPQLGLGGSRPRDLARTEVGAREVEALIERIERGIVV